MNDNKTSKNSIVAKFAVPISFLILFFLAANFTDCDLVTFWKRRSHLTDLVVDMIPPDFSYIQKILLPLFYTIQMSVTGTVLGTFFALVLSPFGAANLGFPAVIRRILRIVIQILRSFPALILALTATFLFGLGTFAGTFAITLYTFAIMTKLTYEDASAADVSLPGTSGYGCFKVCSLYPWNSTRDHSWISHQCTLPVGNQCTAQLHFRICGSWRYRTASQ